MPKLLFNLNIVTGSFLHVCELYDCKKKNKKENTKKRIEYFLFVNVSFRETHLQTFF